MSKTPPVVSGTASTPTRYVITFWTAIGWHGVFTHFGVIMTGNRWTRYRRISKEAEPEPMIIAARSTVTGTPAEASAPSTSRREDRCLLRCEPVSPRPPR